MEDILYYIVINTRILHEDTVFLDYPILQSLSIISVVFLLLGGISNSSQDSSSRMHQKAPQSTLKFKIFWGACPLDMVGPSAHQVPWLVSTSRYATDQLN